MVCGPNSRNTRPYTGPGSVLFLPQHKCACDFIYKGLSDTNTGSWSYQFADLALQVLDAVQLPLAAALRGDAVLAAAADVVNELQLL